MSSLMHSSGPDASGVRLPKLDVPTFDGDILHWSTFWEQFVTSVDSRKHLSNAEKLVYLQHAVKNGSAISVIQGLSQSGEQYTEAVECLKSRYDRPRLVHQRKRSTGSNKTSQFLNQVHYDPYIPLLTMQAFSVLVVVSRILNKVTINNIQSSFTENMLSLNSLSVLSTCDCSMLDH